MVQSLVRTSQWEPERFHSLRHMIMIMMIIITFFIITFMWGIYIIHLKQTMFLGYTVLHLSVFTICATCNTISHVTYVLHLTLVLSELCMCAVSNMAVFLFLYFFAFMLSWYVSEVFPEGSWDSSSYPYYYWYHFCLYIVIIINNKIANNITSIPQLEFCCMGCSEVTIKDLNHEWATYLLENLFFMDANTIRVENFYVFFPQNLNH